MKYQKLETRSAMPLETRNADGEEDDPVVLATRSVEQLRENVEQRNGEIDQMETRLSELEVRSQRPNQQSLNENEPSPERRAFETYLRRGENGDAAEIRALTVSDDEQGGYLAPAEMSNEFIRDLVEYSPIRSVASVRNIGAASVKYPKRTGVSGGNWEGEGEDSEEGNITFGQVEVVARKRMEYVDISNELLADSAGEAEREVRLAFAEKYGQAESDSFVNGDGVKRPEGLMTNPDINHTVNGHATVLAADPLITLMYAMPAVYRNQGSWMLNGTTLATIRKLKDGNGNYLWQPSFQAGQPETILGRPVIEAVEMPDIASGKFPILFGDFSAYRIVDRLAMSILVNPYILATKGITRIHATRRVGGKVLQPARFRKLKMST